MASEVGWSAASPETTQKCKTWGMDVEAITAVTATTDVLRNQATVDLAYGMLCANNTPAKTVASWYLAEVIAGKRHTVFIRAFEKYLSRAYIEEFLNAGG